MGKIDEIYICSNKDHDKFTNLVTKKIIEMQNVKNLDVEIQYSTTSIGLEAIQYSAFIIGRIKV